ncbi:MAG: cbb3-type cytochrome oxidase assembly protein CcoS [Bernardetiaceae bacterium]|nr:cbb3-type cytochrome oxidase assembly protein CcoS [Bernardetiaceae bacterium]
MQIIFILIGVSLLVAVGFLTAFLWSVKSGQYEDTTTPGMRILFENDERQQNDDGTESATAGGEGK